MNSRTAFAIAVAVVSVACGSAPRPPDLVLVVLDTVGPSHLSVYGYERPTSPYLEQFGDGARRFDRAYSSSTWTLPAHASAFTGLSAARHGADQVSQRLDERFQTLAEALGEAGYQTVGFSNNPWLSLERGTARGFESFHELFRKRVTTLPRASEHPTVLALNEWLHGERDPARPAFVFVNLMDAHFPYRPPWRHAQPFFPDQRAWREGLERMAALAPLNLIRRHYLGGTELGLLDAGDIEIARDLHDGEIRYLDTITGALVEAVESATGDDTLIAISSDHGENFGEHDHLGHAFSLYDSTLKIALLVRGPGFEPGTHSDALVHIADLFPTFLAAAGHVVPEGLDGRDLRAPADPERSVAALYAHPVQAIREFPAPHRQYLSDHDRELRAAIIRSHKLIRASDGSEELYDLATDPGERRPLTESDSEAALLQRLREAAGDPRPVPTVESDPLADVDAQTRRALEAMGYLQPEGSAGPSGGTATQPEPAQ